VLESAGVPNLPRAKYRGPLGNAIRQLVSMGTPFSVASSPPAVETIDHAAFTAIVREEITLLQPYNCERFGLRPEVVEDWIRRGRPAS